MTLFHAVMIDETGCEFGVEIEAIDRAAAEVELEDQYPESRVDQIESPQNRRDREETLHGLIASGADFDDEGRPFWPHGRDDFDDDFDDEY